MKKTTAFLFALLFATSFAFSQAVEVGNKIINLDVGYPPVFCYGTAKTPPITVRFDYLAANIGPGILGIGVLAGYASSQKTKVTWPVNNPANYFKYSYVHLAARATYHWFPGQSDKIDTYGALIAGYSIVTSESFGNNLATQAPEVGKALGGFCVGMRYALSPALGVNAELGYGLAIFNIGASFKF